MKNNKWTGERIKKLRKSLNKTQEEFAAILGYSHKQRLSEIENERRPPSKKTVLLLESLYQYARALTKPKRSKK